MFFPFEDIALVAFDFAVESFRHLVLWNVSHKRSIEQVVGFQEQAQSVCECFFGRQVKMNVAVFPNVVIVIS